LRKLCCILLLLAACEREYEGRPTQAPTIEVTYSGPIPDTATAPARTLAPARFDREHVKAGDVVGGLTVSRVRRPPDDYAVSFEGEVEVNGVYRAHFDYPEVKVPCFWVDPDSWAKLPRAQNDQRLIWFCFENTEEAIRQLGELGSQANARIVIDDYRTALSESDVFDSARLVRVISKQAIP
jgi:hypothetical protein